MYDLFNPLAPHVSGLGSRLLRAFRMRHEKHTQSSSSIPQAPGAASQCSSRYLSTVQVLNKYTLWFSPLRKVLNGWTCCETPLMTFAAVEHPAVFHRLFSPQQVKTAVCCWCIGDAALGPGVRGAHGRVCVSQSLTWRLATVRRRASSDGEATGTMKGLSGMCSSLKRMETS